MKKHLKVQNESRKPSEQETFQRTSRGVVCGIHRKRDNKTGEGEIYLFIFIFSQVLCFRGILKLCDDAFSSGKSVRSYLSAWILILTLDV